MSDRCQRLLKCGAGVSDGGACHVCAIGKSTEVEFGRHSFAETFGMYIASRVGPKIGPWGLQLKLGGRQIWHHIWCCTGSSKIVYMCNA